MVIDWDELKKQREEWQKLPEPECDCNGTEEHMPGQPNDMVKWHLPECALAKHWETDPGHASHHKCVMCGKQATEWCAQGFGCDDCMENY